MPGEGTFGDLLGELIGEAAAVGHVDLFRLEVDVGPIGPVLILRLVMSLPFGSGWASRG